MKLIGKDPTLVTSRVCAPESLRKAAREIFPVARYDYVDGAEGCEWKYPAGAHKLGSCLVC